MHLGAAQKSVVGCVRSASELSKLPQLDRERVGQSPPNLWVPLRSAIVVNVKSWPPCYVASFDSEPIEPYSKRGAHNLVTLPRVRPYTFPGGPDTMVAKGHSRRRTRTDLDINYAFINRRLWDLAMRRIMNGVVSCEDRVCVVTGAGRGLGREYALALAHHGARVVVNDLGGGRDGSGQDSGPAAEVVAQIRESGGEAVANTDDVSSWDGSAHLIEQAVTAFGGLDVLVNNAGILRDRMLFSMSEQEWDAVIQVHLKGTFAPSHHAAAYWRERSKAGAGNDARLINTTSVSGLYANPGQSNYGAAKAGIAAFTQIAAQELQRYGVTVNAIAPGALTRLTEDLPMSDELRSNFAPSHVAPVVTWLASTESSDVTGQVIEASGLVLAVAEGWHRGPATAAVSEAADVGQAVRGLLAECRPRTLFHEVS